MTHAYAHIACCIDPEGSAPAALETALALRRGVPGRLSLVHGAPYSVVVEQVHDAPVFRRDDPEASARDWLRRRAAEFPGAEPVFVRGMRGPATCEWAAGADVNLIVVGAGSGRLPGLAPGGFVHHLVENAPCPVLVVRGATGPGPPAAASAAAGDAVRT